MKSTQSILWLASALLLIRNACADSDDSGSSSSDNGVNMTYWETTESQTRSREPQLASDGTIKRFVNIPLKDSTITIVQELKNDDHNSTDESSGRKLEDLETPFPQDGAELQKTGTAIHFREDTTISDVACFIFDHQHPDQSFRVCDGENGIEITFEEGIAEVQLTGFQVGEYTWCVEDSSGNRSEPQKFTVVEPDEVVRRSFQVPTDDFDDFEYAVGEAEWDYGGDILQATGRIYYTSYGEDYACTGTVMKDRKSGRTLILTAAHCVFDDIDWVFGSHAVFIPNRDSIQTTLTGKEIHRQCTEDVCGCWSLSAGVVLAKWRDTPWPARLEYDYGIWVVDDVGAHDGQSCGSDALDEAVPEFEFQVGVNMDTAKLHALGYSLEHNPDFRYCSDETSMNQPTTGVNTYWLPGCGLTGGASGGPWISEMDKTTGKGKIVSVNSWSYADEPGLGGPIIDESAARCLVNAARTVDFEAIRQEPEGEQGIFVNCYERPCIPQEEYESRRLRGTLNGRVLCEHVKGHKE